jgi:hypothetical protein
LVGWFIVLATALTTRLIVLLSSAVSFHSDEAVVALMARHINGGAPIPTFFYGQYYMGSLDPLIVAAFFRVFGESVGSIRIAQTALYFTFLISGVLFAQQVSRRRGVAIITGLLLAVPALTVTLYTSMTLGGYGEVLILGNLVLMLGWAIAHDPVAALSWRSWAALGLVAGLGWWTNALIAVYLLPVALYLIVQLTPKFLIAHWRLIALALAAFLIGGAPWWVYSVQHEWLPLRWLLSGSQSNNGLSFTVGERALGFLFVGVPAILGIRYPWADAGWAGPVALPVIGLFIASLAYGLVRARRATGGLERFLLLVIACFALIFIGSAFGTDITGRYLLPLIVPFAVLMALFLAALGGTRRGPRLSGRVVLAAVALTVLITFQAAGTLVAMTRYPGITSQFDLVNHIPNDDDQALIAFLKSHQGTRGFSTYWLTFRIAFLSQERVILDAWLPNKLSLIYTPVDRRYPPYTEAVSSALRPVYVTANVPALDTLISDGLAKRNITYDYQTIGPYHIYYNLSARVTPAELGVIPRSSEPPSTVGQGGGGWVAVSAAP